MDILFDISPYWAGDVLASDAAAKDLASVSIGDGPIDGSALSSLPCSPLAVLTPLAAAPERPERRYGILLTPFPYLPDEVWMRRPGEGLPGYHMRILIALDALGLIEADERDMPRLAAIDGAPEDTASAQAMLAAFDRRGDDGRFDAIRERIAQSARAAWPEGYPADAEMVNGQLIASLSMTGSAVVAAQRAVALGAVGPEGAAQAVALLKRIQESYGPLFDPEAMDPPHIAQWVIANKGRAIDMLSQLADAGFESQSTVDAARQVFA
jgi:hypothetical protein